GIVRGWMGKKVFSAIVVEISENCEGKGTVGKKGGLGRIEKVFETIFRFAVKKDFKGIAFAVENNQVLKTVPVNIKAGRLDAVQPACKSIVQGFSFFRHGKGRHTLKIRKLLGHTSKGTYNEETCQSKGVSHANKIVDLNF